VKWFLSLLILAISGCYAHNSLINTVQDRWVPVQMVQKHVPIECYRIGNLTFETILPAKCPARNVALSWVQDFQDRTHHFVADDGQVVFVPYGLECDSVKQAWGCTIGLVSYVDDGLDLANLGRVTEHELLHQYYWWQSGDGDSQHINPEWSKLEECTARVFLDQIDTSESPR
jgi:hypothetical protein